MKSVVTGAAGFIGSHLAEELLEIGHQVVGIDSFTEFYPRQMKESNLFTLQNNNKFRLVEGRLQDLNLERVLSGADYIFHMAAQAGVRTSWGESFSDYVDNNIIATQVLLESCKKLHLKKLVYASSSSVYGDVDELPMSEDMKLCPISPYGVTKLAGERLSSVYHKSYRIPVIILRYFTVYGPRQRPDMAFHRFLRAAIDGNTIVIYGDGSQTRDFTYVSDAVRATLAAVEKGKTGKVYNIGGGNRVSLKYALGVIKRVVGEKLKVKWDDFHRGDMRHTYADTTRAKRELHFTPQVDLEAGLKQQYQWMLSD
ncbi:UDP-glucose 4-epimerase [bacterium (candidate division B38) B3_B38]|nr:MAG: UDP-glucose 4-epimerase [bacterium (candidate division B38) B3_B38]